MTQFLHNFACFDCQVSFKRPATENSSTGNAYLAESELAHYCPNCGHKMAFMGRNFATPKKTDLSGWQAAKLLWEAGFRFVGSGSHTDAPLPRNGNATKAFILENKTHHQKVAIECKWSEHA